MFSLASSLLIGDPSIELDRALRLIHKVNCESDTGFVRARAEELLYKQKHPGLCDGPVEYRRGFGLYYVHEQPIVPEVLFQKS